MANHGFNYLIYETFDYRDWQHHADLTPVKVIGIIEEWRRQIDPTLPLVPQLAQQAKFYFKDWRIKDAGLWTKGKPHGMDALRHLLYWRQDYLV